MRHTEGMRQSVIMTRKLDDAAFCIGAIMTFDSKLRHYDVRHNGMHHNGVRQSGMRQNTIPPLIAAVKKFHYTDPRLTYNT
jgi:hypothetical protein